MYLQLGGQAHECILNVGVLLGRCLHAEQNLRYVLAQVFGLGELDLNEVILELIRWSVRVMDLPLDAPPGRICCR